MGRAEGLELAKDVGQRDVGTLKENGAETEGGYQALASSTSMATGDTSKWIKSDVHLGGKDSITTADDKGVSYAV
jgi:hypothetical protein